MKPVERASRPIDDLLNIFRVMLLSIPILAIPLFVDTGLGVYGGGLLQLLALFLAGPFAYLQRSHWTMLRSRRWWVPATVLSTFVGEVIAVGASDFLRRTDPYVWQG